MIEMLIEFLLFGTVEVFILLMFYKTVGGFKTVKYWHGILLCPVFYMFGLVPFPFVKQISMMIVMAIYLLVVSKENTLKVIKVCLLGFMYLLLIETILFFLYGIVVSYDFTQNTLIKFLFILPVRIVEILIIYLIGGKINWDGFGGAVCPKLKTKKKK